MWVLGTVKPCLYSSLFPLQKLELQRHLVEDVMLHLLSDEDGRVRHAAAVALVAVVPRLFFPVDSPQHDPVIAKAEVTRSHTHTQSV